MTSRAYLADTSVWARVGQDLVGGRLLDLAQRYLLWTCRMVDLEVTHGSRARDVPDVIEQRLQLPEAPMHEAVMNRAMQVTALLASAGHHRAASPADLLIAAAAEAHHLTLLHYDADFERIAAVTRQPTEWVAEPGSLD